MNFLDDPKFGSSACFTGRYDRAGLRTLASVGIDCIELTGKYISYFDQWKFVDRAAEYGRMAREEGVEIWSLHLPFSRNIDISNTDKEIRSMTLRVHKTLIDRAAIAGAGVIVLHPSAEPIDELHRPERMRLSREAICELNEECVRLGLRLAVEDLPRLCLCNRSDEMIELLSGTGAGVVFDTNHSLREDNVHFIDALTAAGIRIHTLHISDYFRDERGVLDERHVLPGEGINDWDGILDALLRHGYEGPLMYEVPAHPKYCERPYTPEELAENMRRLAARDIKSGERLRRYPMPEQTGDRV